MDETKIEKFQSTHAPHPNPYSTGQHIIHSKTQYKVKIITHTMNTLHTSTVTTHTLDTYHMCLPYPADATLASLIIHSPASATPDASQSAWGRKGRKRPGGAGSCCLVPPGRLRSSTSLPSAVSSLSSPRRSRHSLFCPSMLR